MPIGSHEEVQGNQPIEKFDRSFVLELGYESACNSKRERSAMQRERTPERERGGIQLGNAQKQGIFQAFGQGLFRKLGRQRPRAALVVNQAALYQVLE